MSGKSIYVMDTPKACDECPLSLETEKIDTIICRGCKKYSVNPKCTERPDWCPLKETPKMIDEKPVSEYEHGLLGKGFEIGWNNCIRIILIGSSH